MGLFDSFLSNNSNNWPGPKLEDIDQLNTIAEASFLKPQLIFKHSTRCSVSRFVLNDFTSSYGFSEVDFTAYFLDLLRYREISNAIANQFDVVHQSPQLLIIKDGKAIAHASHENVNKIKLTEFLN
ncbi:MAG: bacillithiol system redox-active protein YtxJ [Flavobacteriaceae bacterium]